MLEQTSLGGSSRSGDPTNIRLPTTCIYSISRALLFSGRTFIRQAVGISHQKAGNIVFFVFTYNST